jgi:hypothetical protein
MADGVLDKRVSRCAADRTLGDQQMKVTITFAATLGIAAALAMPARAQTYVSAAQLYPYCQINSSNGGMNCYISSRAQCEFREVCIKNPRYLGDDRARDWMRRNKPEWRWW